MDNRIVGGIYEFLKAEKVYTRKNDSCAAKLASHCHAFAVLEINEVYCKGFMLTHATTADFPEHQLMEQKHFIKGWKFQFDKTHFLRVPLVKMNSLGTLQVGMLSAEGIKFINSSALGQEITWDQYISEYCGPK